MVDLNREQIRRLALFVAVILATVVTLTFGICMCRRCCRESASSSGSATATSAGARNPKRPPAEPFEHEPSVDPYDKSASKKYADLIEEESDAIDNEPEVTAQTVTSKLPHNSNQSSELPHNSNQSSNVPQLEKATTNWPKIRSLEELENAIKREVHRKATDKSQDGLTANQNVLNGKVDTNKSTQNETPMEKSEPCFNSVPSKKEIEFSQDDEHEQVCSDQENSQPTDRSTSPTPPLQQDAASVQVDSITKASDASLMPQLITNEAALINFETFQSQIFDFYDAFLAAKGLHPHIGDGNEVSTNEIRNSVKFLLQDMIEKKNFVLEPVIESEHNLSLLASIPVTPSDGESFLQQTSSPDAINNSVATIANFAASSEENSKTVFCPNEIKVSKENSILLKSPHVRIDETPDAACSPVAEAAILTVSFSENPTGEQQIGHEKKEEIEQVVKETLNDLLVRVVNFVENGITAEGKGECESDEQDKNEFASTQEISTQSSVTNESNELTNSNDESNESTNSNDESNESTNSNDESNESTNSNEATKELKNSNDESKESTNSNDESKESTNSNEATKELKNSNEATKELKNSNEATNNQPSQHSEAQKKSEKVQTLQSIEEQDMGDISIIPSQSNSSTGLFNVDNKTPSDYVMIDSTQQSLGTTIEVIEVVRSKKVPIKKRIYKPISTELLKGVKQTLAKRPDIFEKDWLEICGQSIRSTVGYKKTVAETGKIAGFEITEKSNEDDLDPKNYSTGQVVSCVIDVEKGKGRSTGIISKGQVEFENLFGNTAPDWYTHFGVSRFTKNIVMPKIFQQQLAKKTSAQRRNSFKHTKKGSRSLYERKLSRAHASSSIRTRKEKAKSHSSSEPKSISEEFSFSFGNQIEETNIKSEDKTGKSNIKFEEEPERETKVGTDSSCPADNIETKNAAGHESSVESGTNN